MEEELAWEKCADLPAGRLFVDQDFLFVASDNEKAVYRYNFGGAVESTGAGLYCTQRKKFIWLSDQVLRCSLLDDGLLYQLTTNHEVYKTRVVLS
ncbi:MAG: hypothetical protein KC800_02160 [Candidatus Eremiobacteraeota bacterium]|nr:hypothetical protein [Candidatus Eremiobacteraeota bacterium]